MIKIFKFTLQELQLQYFQLVFQLLWDCPWCLGEWTLWRPGELQSYPQDLEYKDPNLGKTWNHSQGQQWCLVCCSLEICCIPGTTWVAQMYIWSPDLVCPFEQLLICMWRWEEKPLKSLHPQWKWHEASSTLVTWNNFILVNFVFNDLLRLTSGQLFPSQQDA